MRHRLLLTTLCALLLSQCRDEVSLSPDTLQSHFHLPCRELHISESCFTPDQNVLVVQLHTAPGDGFYTDLLSRGVSATGKALPAREL